MLRGDWHVGACLLAGLYLPYENWRLAPLRRWPRVVDCLLSHEQSGSLGALRSAGLWEEVSLLEEPGRLGLAEDFVDRGQVLTVFDGKYPVGWLDALGSGAPPVLWCEGEIPGGELVGVVGSRDLPTSAKHYAHQMGGYLVSSGRGVVSGGAWGADELGVAGAVSKCGDAPVVQLLPCGFDSGGYGRPKFSGCLLSPFDRRAGFTGTQAMIRNRLIYAWSRRSVVVHSRYRVGGTWGGATDALRRGLGRVIVADWRDSATDALVALGGDRLNLGREWRSELDYRLRLPLEVAQPDLFGFSGIKERRQGYGDQALGALRESAAAFA
ncbi:MAG: DNA-processing protein DprA [Fimbriimonadaceae bacterium]